MGKQASGSPVSQIFGNADHFPARLVKRFAVHQLDERFYFQQGCADVSGIRYPTVSPQKVEIFGDERKPRAGTLLCTKPRKRSSWISGSFSIGMRRT